MSQPKHFDVMEKYGGLSQKVYQLTEDELDIATAYVERLIASRPKPETKKMTTWHPSPNG